MKFIVGLLLCLIPAVALAQQPAPTRPQTMDDRIGAQIGALVLRTTAQDMQIEMLQKQLEAAQKRVKELEAAVQTTPETPAAK